VKQNKNPNILIFMTDQQRGDSAPPYSKAKMPNLEKFKQEGVAFSNTFCPSPHCCPSRATFFSGLYPSQHGVWNNVDVGNTLSRGLYEGVRLWSEDLKNAGYDMHFSGKWHVSAVESPVDRGWEMNTLHLDIKCDKQLERPHTREWEKYLQAASQPEQKTRKEGEILRSGYFTYTHYGKDESPFTDREVVDDALHIIRSHKKHNKPWCQFVGTLGPHDPYFVPERFLKLYNIEDIELPANFYDEMTDKPNLYMRTRERFDQLTEYEHKEAIRHYLAFCSYEDALFGEIIDELREMDELDNTFVLYVSDHGDYAAEHGLWCKGLPCFKSGYHVPAVIRWPEGIKESDRIVDDFISLADFAPTLLEIAGISVERKFAGQNLVPFLEGERPKQWREEIFTQSNGNELYGIQRSVMTQRWKYVYNGFDYDELYDLQSDPGEMKNLIGEPNYDEITKQLMKKIWRFAYENDDVCINDYIMVALAPYGPAEAFRE